jgi:hypothetical protein
MRSQVINSKPFKKTSIYGVKRALLVALLVLIEGIGYKYFIFDGHLLLIDDLNKIVFGSFLGMYILFSDFVLITKLFNVTNKE